MEHSDFFQRIHLAGTPLAHPSGVVVRGNVRFTVLTPRLLRLEWSPTGEFTDLATFAFPNRWREEPPAFTVREDDALLRLDTGALTLTYRRDSGAFTPENLAISFRLGDDEQTWRPGERDSQNLGGTRRTLDLTGGDVPLEPGLVSRAGWALFDDSQGVVFGTDDGWVGARPQQSVQDWYFFGYGHDYTDALADYTRFGGAVPLIPRYELGIWWSRFWPYSAADLQQLVTDFADHRLPLDVLVVDMDWHTPGHWTGYTWNRDLFPDPEAFLAELHARGLRITLNLHPADGVHPHEGAYQEMAQALGMPLDAATPIPFQITDRQFAAAYFMILHHPLEDQGVDFWWLDWQQGESSEIAGLDPLIWLNHLHFVDARRRNQRPMLFSRWGGLGNHRYPIGFSGDTFGGWATLAALPRFTATAANVDFGWWSHDIGGHFGAATPELFTRWVQFGALSPCLRLHATLDPLAERRPWAFTPPVLDAVREAFALRYQLVPYLYTMARGMFEHGGALCRPMYHAYPEHEAAYEAHGQYLFGDDLIAAPITQPADPRTDLATFDVWLPPGEWCRFATGEALPGSRWVRLTGDLATMPLFARAGAIIPLAAPALHLAAIPNDHLDVQIFPGGDGVFRLYEDDGISEDYLGDAYEWTTFTCVGHGTAQREVRIAPVEDHCAALPATRAYTLTFIGVASPEQVMGDSGEPLDWSFDQTGSRLHVHLPARSKEAEAHVVVRWSASERVQSSAPIVATAPFAHVITHTAYDEAQRQLGKVILVPPYAPSGAASRCDADIVWRTVQHVGVTETRQALRDLDAATSVNVPFALDPAWQPQHWEVVTSFAGVENNTTEVFHGPYVHPPIQHWRLRYAGAVEWRDAQPNAASCLNITDPYQVQLDTHIAAGAEAVAIIDLPEQTHIWLDTWTSGSLTLVIDGKEMTGGVPQAELIGSVRRWPVQRFGPVALTMGRHVISARLTASDALPWVFGVLLVDQDGVPLMRCASVRDE